MRLPNLDVSSDDIRTSGPRLISAERLAAILEVSKRTLWRLRSAGRLPRPIQLGGSVRWRADEIEQWIARGCPPLLVWETYRATAEET